MGRAHPWGVSGVDHWVGNTRTELCGVPISYTNIYIYVYSCRQQQAAQVELQAAGFSGGLS